MATLDIVKYPAEALRRPADAVTTIDDTLRARIAAMFDTMYAAPGVGLAAPQVGDTGRYFVMDAEAETRGRPLAMINPVILDREGQIVWEEGCLSIPGFQAEVERAERIELEAADLEGNLRRYSFEGLPAVIAQHEIDHLDGILFVDHISRTRQRLFERDFGADRFKWKYRPHR